MAFFPWKRSRTRTSTRVYAIMSLETTVPGNVLSKADNSRVLHACYVYHFLNDGIMFILPTVMGFLFRRFHLDWFEAGVVYAMNLLSMIVFQLAMGYCSDKFDQKKIMFGGMALLGGSTILMAFSVDYYSLLLLGILLGLGFGVQHASSYSISSRIKNEKVNRQSAAGDAGKGAAILVSTMFLFFLNGDLAWQIPFLAWGFATIAILCVDMVWLRSYNLFPSGFVKGRQAGDGKVATETGTITLKQILALSSFFALFMLYNAQSQVISNNLTTYFTEYKGFDIRVAPVFFVVFFLFAFLGSTSSLGLSKRIGKKRHVILNYTIFLAALLMFVFFDTRDPASNLLFLGAIAFFSSTIYPVILEVMSSKTPKTRLGLVFGIIMGIGWAGGFVASLLAGYVAEAFTAQSMFLITIVAVIISAVIAWKTRFV